MVGAIRLVRWAPTGWPSLFCAVWETNFLPNPPTSCAGVGPDLMQADEVLQGDCRERSGRRERCSSEAACRRLSVEVTDGC